jgi:hypothetical protein
MLSLVCALALAASTGLAAPAVQTPINSVVEHEMVTTLQAEEQVLAYWTVERVASIDHDPYATEPLPPIPDDDLPRGSEFDVQGIIPKTVGRLLYSEPYEGGFRDSSCTATILQSANEASIVTAAHCLKPNPTISNNTEWHINVLFLPGFRDEAPHVNFTLNRAFLLSGWVSGPEVGDDRYRNDRAFAVLNLHSPPKRSARASLGPGQSIQFVKNATDYDLVYNLGYPRYVAAPDELRGGSPAFTGRRLAACYGKPEIWWRAPSNMAGFPCQMGGGSSGGPHLAEFNANEGVGTVVSVNSVLDQGDQNTLPLIELGSTVSDDLAKQLFDAAQAVKPSVS